MKKKKQFLPISIYTSRLQEQNQELLKIDMCIVLWCEINHSPADDEKDKPPLTVDCPFWVLYWESTESVKRWEAYTNQGQHTRLIISQLSLVILSPFCPPCFSFLALYNPLVVISKFPLFGTAYKWFCLPVPTASHIRLHMQLIPIKLTIQH